MILNVFNKILTDKELKVLNNLKKVTSLVNIDLTNKNKKLKHQYNDIKEHYRDILISANKSSIIIIWGATSVEVCKNKTFHSLMNRENVFYSCFEMDDYDQYMLMKNKLPNVYDSSINKFLSDGKEDENFYSIDELEIKNEKKENSILKGLREVFSNVDLIKKMSLALFNQETLNTTLGAYWHLVRDVVFFITYLMFMMFMRGNGDIDGIPAIVFLVTGLVAWYFMSDVMNGGTACIKAAKGIISKVKFPIVTIPFYSTLSILYRRGLTYVILFLVVGIYMLMGSSVSINFVLLLYYTFSMVVFMMAFNLIFSALIAISRDFHELYKSFIRIQMYFNPIFWDITTIMTRLDNASFFGVEIIKVLFQILMLNPTVYILNGYRESFGASAGNGWISGTVFWVLVVGMFLVGFRLQDKVKGIYADII